MAGAETTLGGIPVGAVLVLNGRLYAKYADPLPNGHVEVELLAVRERAHDKPYFERAVQGPSGRTFYPAATPLFWVGWLYNSY